MDRTKSKAAQELAAKRWAGHTPPKCSMRRLRVATIDRVNAHARSLGTTFDGAVTDLLDRNAKTH